MDDQGVLQRIDHWYRTGDGQALAEALPWLEGWLPYPPGVQRMLGAAEVEALRMEVLEHLVTGEPGQPPRLLGADKPRAFARVAFRNRLWDALHDQARQPDLLDTGIAADVTARTLAHAPPSIELQLDEHARLQRAVEAMAALRVDARAAVLLLHAPDRLPEADWDEVRHRHPPPPPPRPRDVLSREEIAALLFPGVPASTAYERTGKLIQRTYEKLRRELGTPDTQEEEGP